MDKNDKDGMEKSEENVRMMKAERIKMYPCLQFWTGQLEYPMLSVLVPTTRGKQLTLEWSRGMISI